MKRDYIKAGQFVTFNSRKDAVEFKVVEQKGSTIKVVEKGTNNRPQTADTSMVYKVSSR